MLQAMIKRRGGIFVGEPPVIEIGLMVCRMQMII